MDIQSMLSHMTLEEKVGQMFMLAFAGNHLDQAREMLVGHRVGACYISQDNAATPQEAFALTTALQELAASTPQRIPLILGADQEGAWGVMVPHSCTGPGNMGLGAANNPESTHKMYRVIGKELSAVGYNTLLAPCIDVNSNPENVIVGARSFGEFQDRVAENAGAAIRGAKAGGVITTAKHYPGHGDTHQDSHRLLPSVDRSLEELEKIDLLPYQAAIAANVDIVMTAHILYPKIDPANPATMSRIFLNDLLRVKLGFKGLILSDSMNMFAIRKNYAPDEAAVLAVLAGVDMIMLAEEHYDHTGAYLEKQRVTVNGVLKAAQSGRISIERIDDAVSRVLTLKASHGLFDAHPEPASISLVGGDENRAIEASVAEEGVALVLNQNYLLQKAKSGKTVVVGAAPRKAYEILTRTRGIGPNQDQAAFDVFAAEFKRYRPGTAVIGVDDLTTKSPLPDEIKNADVIIAVTEDYPLPGVDFDTRTQIECVRRLIAEAGEKLLVVALRPPYDFCQYPGLKGYLTTCSSRPCAAQAAAKAAAGVIPCNGTLPVSLV